MQVFDYDFDNDKEIFLETPQKKPNFIDCINCEKKFYSKQILELHQIFRHKIFLYKCPRKNCTKSFFREEYLKEHIDMVHKGSKIEKLFKCDKTQKCINKGVAFKTQGGLNRHFLRHGPKNHVCSECGKSFAMKDYLEAHMRSHTGEKTYPCKICGQSFGSTFSRTYHEQHLH
jgi:KRAB domain-containing zinc finger protein